MFANRRSAGRQLGERLQHLRPEKPVVLALPRGGVPVGFEIAERLDAPLDVALVRKIGVPWQPELALGAVGDGAEPHVIINEALAADLGFISATDYRSRSPAVPSSLSMTGLPPAAPCARRFAPSVRREPEGSSSPSRWRPRTRSSGCERRSTRSSASSPRAHSLRSERTMTNFHSSPTPMWSRCWRSAIRR